MERNYNEKQASGKMHLTNILKVNQRVNKKGERVKEHERQNNAMITKYQ